MAANPTHPGAGASHSTSYEPASRSAGTLSSLWSIINRWIDDSVTRRRLEDLDDHLLRDIGFDPRAVRRESAQPFWQPIALERSRN